MSTVVTSPAIGERSQRSGLQRAWLALRVLVPVAVVIYLAATVPLRETLGALRSIRPQVLAEATAVAMCGMLMAAWRWRLVFTACGMVERPGIVQLLRLHLIGFFYNTFVPGGVGGEVVRAIAIRPLFGDRGFAGALGLVMLERVLGLAGMLILVAGTFSLFPLGQIPNVMLFSTIGLCAAAAAVFGIATASRIARFLPGPLARLAAALPTVHHVRPFLGALVLSVGTHAAGVVMGHLLMVSLAGHVSITDSLVVMPLIGSSQYFPLSVGGVGIREATFVLFYGLVGVEKPLALAASLANTGVFWTVAALGGVLQILRPLRVDARR
jgi:uncharacterized protein (TIRG00374 family)